MASFVLIWEQNMYQNQKVKGHTWPGHSSLNIGDRIITGHEFSTAESLEEIMAFARANVDNYVSWWPTKVTSGFGAAGAFDPRKIGATAGGSIANDIKMEKYLPDHVIKLDTSPTDEANMQAEWNAIRKKKGASYKVFRKNCSTIVSRVLHAGGYYSLKWAENNNWVWAPSDILKLALAAGGTKMKWQDFRTLLTNAGVKSVDYDQIWQARSGSFCSTGAAVKYQRAG